MRLCLVQHGEAKEEESDPERPLTEKGREDANRVAARLAESGFRPELVFHSPKLRARQTADIFASHFHARSSLAEGLQPNDDPSVARDFAAARERDVVLVGHLPHLSKLASLLLTGSPESQPVRFRMAAAVCLEKDGGAWKLSWMLPPELA